jgi:hypothetical protein
VRLYPRSFRDEYGDDMVLLFEDQRAAEPALRVWCRSLLDLTLSVPTRHLEAHVHRSSPQPLLTVLAAAGAVVALVVGLVVGSVAAPALLVVVGATWLANASRRAERPVDAPMWWRRVVVGGVLIGLVGAATNVPWPDSMDIGGDLAWSLGAITIIAGITLMSSGAVAGALSLLGRRRSAP